MPQTLPDVETRRDRRASDLEVDRPTEDRVETSWTPELVAWLQAEAFTVGFDRAGVAPVEGVDGNEDEARDAARFEDWVEAGRAGEMEYLKRRDAEGRLLRSSARIPMEWARSVVVFAFSYRGEGPLSIDRAPPETGWIARYAWSGRREAGSDHLVARDYHDDLLERLRGLEDRIQSRIPCQTKCYVDTGPLVERSLAARAGIGWIGKNTCVLSQELGSWTLLATVVTSIPVPRTMQISSAADRCGSCTRCIDACPTEALVVPREMDATRCIAYLTIEKKGSIAEELRAGMGRQIFGCDICQEVCPWNRRSVLPGGSAAESRPELVNPDLEEIAAMEPRDFRQRFKGSPLERTGLKRLRRNVAIAMGNSGEERFAERLERWSGAEDPVLAEAAQWANDRIREQGPGAPKGG